MKQIYLKTLLLCLFTLAGITVHAYDAEIDGIYYNLNKDKMTAEVTYLSSNSLFSSNKKAYSGKVVIPSTVLYNGTTYSVTSIGNNAFRYCSGLTSITIPESVTSIGKSAFNSCSGLQKVIVPDIAAWCKISFGLDQANPLYWAYHLFSDENTEITNLVIPNSVTSIGNDAFLHCSSLTSITIPNSVTSIGNYAFSECI